MKYSLECALTRSVGKAEVNLPPFAFLHARTDAITSRNEMSLLFESGINPNAEIIIT